MNIRQFVKDHKTELVLGAAHGLVTALFIGWWALLVAPVTAFLFAYGGSSKSGSSAYRRVGVPVATSLAYLVAAYNGWAAVLLGLGFGVLSIGYGLPSTQPYDEGSAIGAWVFKKFKLTPHNHRDEMFANVIIRGGLFLVYALPYVLVKVVL